MTHSGHPTAKPDEHGEESITVAGKLTAKLLDTDLEHLHDRPQGFHVCVVVVVLGDQAVFVCLPASEIVISAEQFVLVDQFVCVLALVDKDKLDEHTVESLEQKGDFRWILR